MTWVNHLIYYYGPSHYYIITLGTSLGTPYYPPRYITFFCAQESALIPLVVYLIPLVVAPIPLVVALIPLVIDMI